MIVIDFIADIQAEREQLMSLKTLASLLKPVKKWEYAAGRAGERDLKSSNL
jgi:hypothetical protein